MREPMMALKFTSQVSIIGRLRSRPSQSSNWRSGERLSRSIEPNSKSLSLDILPRFAHVRRKLCSTLNQQASECCSYVGDLIARLEQKARLEHKYKQFERLAAKKQLEAAETVERSKEQHELLCESTRSLQAEVGHLPLVTAITIPV